MSSNFACEAVQRSAGANPTYLYAPAPDGNVERTPDSDIFQLDVSSGFAYDISFAVVFPANGVYFVSATCVTQGFGEYSVSGVFNYVVLPAETFLFGSSQTVVQTTPTYLFSQLAVVNGSLGLAQNSGSTLRYNFLSNRISSIA